MAENMKDYATTTVATAPSPATSGTSLVVSSGHGPRLPATPFYATVHPDGELPTLDNAEKVQVTNVSTDTLTIVRAQGDTTAKSIDAGWRISNTVFAADISDGDVTGPASSTDNAIARFDGTTGKVLNSDSSFAPTIEDSGITRIPYQLIIGTSSPDYLDMFDGELYATQTIQAVGNVIAGGQVRTDVIAEDTTAAGVTIDGVLVKDGAVDGRDVSVDGTKLDGIEAGADVTDATNVAAAGAYMSGGTDVAIADGGTGASTAAGARTNLSVPEGSGVAKITVNTAAPTSPATGDIWLDTDDNGTNTIDYYPVGTVYTNKTNSANPSTYLPGQSGSTWVAIEDVFIVARGSTYTGTGGSATHSHTLSDSGHAKINISNNVVAYDRVDSASWTSTQRLVNIGGTYENNSTSTTRSPGLGGSTDSGSNIPPYQAVYAWERTA